MSACRQSEANFWTYNHKVFECIPPILWMIGCCIRQVASGYRAVPGGNNRSIPCYILQTAERIEFQRDIKKYLEIIQQYCLIMGCANDVS